MDILTALQPLPLPTIALTWLILVSLVSIAVTVVDKRRAKRGAWRVPEATLLTLAALGGSVVMWGTMLVIRHKTKHVKFMIGIPLLVVFQGIFVIWVWRKGYSLL